MKLLHVIIMIILMLTGVAGFAQEHGFGLGIILGEPTGISLKMWLDQYSAVDGGLAWSFITPASFTVHADYLYHFLNDFSEPILRAINFYAGIGGKSKISTEDFRIGLRIPLGLVFFVSRFPLDIFIEIVPAIDVFPETLFTPNMGLGVRYFFNASSE